MDTQVTLAKADSELRLEVGIIVRRFLAGPSVDQLGSCYSWPSGFASVSVTGTRRS